MKKSPSTSKSSLVEQCAPLNSFLLICQEKIRLKRFIEQLNKLSSADSSTPEIFYYRADQLTSDKISSIKTDLQSLDLFGSNKLHVITGADQLKASFTDELTELTEHSSDSAKLIIHCFALQTASRLYKFFDKTKTLFEIPPLEGAQLKTWVQAELKRNGVTTNSVGPIQSLIDLGEASADQLSVMIEQISCYLNDQPLSDEAIRTLFGTKHVANQFEVADKIASGRIAETEILLQRLRSNGLSTFVLLAILAKTYQNITCLKDLKSQGQQEREILSTLKISPWQFQKLQPLLKNYSLQQLTNIYWTFFKIDLKLKSKSVGETNLASILASDLLPTPTKN